MASFTVVNRHSEERVLCKERDSHGVPLGEGVLCPWVCIRLFFVLCSLQDNGNKKEGQCGNHMRFVISFLLFQSDPRNPMPTVYFYFSKHSLKPAYASKCSDLNILKLFMFSSLTRSEGVKTTSILTDNSYQLLTGNTVWQWRSSWSENPKLESLTIWFFFLV